MTVRFLLSIWIIVLFFAHFSFEQHFPRLVAITAHLGLRWRPEELPKFCLWSFSLRNSSASSVLIEVKNKNNPKSFL